MSVLEVIFLLIIAGLSGGIAQSLTGYSHGGCLASIVLGFIGALLGTWLQRSTGLPEIFALQVGDRTFPVIWSVIGGVVFSAVLGLITRPRRTI